MKKIIYGTLAILAVILIVFFISKSSNVSGTDLVADEALVYVYTYDQEAPTDFGFIELSFTEDSSKEWFVNIFKDEAVAEETTSDDLAEETITLANGDEISIPRNPFSVDTHWVVQNVPINTAVNGIQRFSFPSTDLDLDPEAGSPYSVSLSSKKISSADDVEDLTVKDLAMQTTIVTIDTEFGINIPGAHEDLKRGIGKVAYAQGVDHISGQDFWTNGDHSANTPDLTGGPMDCFAIATTNNLISLAEANESDVEFPSPREMIAELKRDMQYSDGIIKANFLTGKAAFVERYNLPVTTEQIDRPSMDDLQDALESGGAIEISTTMLRSRSGRANTGHVLTGVGGYRDGSEAGIGVHDPATPQGMDTFEITQTGGENPYLMINYGMWDGITIIDAIFIQTWNEEETSIEETSNISLEENEELLIGGPVSLATDFLVEMAFDHVAPGSYSEVYISVTGEPGHEVTVTLSGPAVDKPSKQVKTADQNGVAHFTYKIFQFGTYQAAVSVEGNETKVTESVVVN